MVLFAPRLVEPVMDSRWFEQGRLCLSLGFAGLSHWRARRIAPRSHPSATGTLAQASRLNAA